MSNDRHGLWDVACVCSGKALNTGAVFRGPTPEERPIGRIDLDAFYDSYRPLDDRVDVVVFAAPQLSLTELASLARLLDGQHIAEGVALVVCTSPEMKAGADRLGLSRILKDAGALLLEGVCFYQMHAREIGQANHWRHLLSNSAKLEPVDIRHLLSRLWRERLG